MKSLHSVLGALLFAAVGTATHGQILIGQTAGFTGAVAAGVKETTDGAKIYLDSVNAKGGINGQKIELLSLDDKFIPQLAGDNAKSLIEDKEVVAMFLTRGTPHTQAVLPHLEKHGVPLIGPSTGAMVLHSPVHKHIFNVRATYQREAEKAITHLASIGIARIALVHADDSFGEDGITGAQKGLTSVKLTATAIEKFDRTKPNFSQIVPKITKMEAQAVLMVASGSAVADGIKALRAAGSSAQVVTLSNNASGGFIKGLGDNARGVIVTQVFPQSIGFRMVKEAVDLARSQNISEVTPAMLEGFAAAKVLVEGLRRSGPKPSRERLQEALEGMRKFDLGGLELSYSPTDHSGLNFADLSIITADGKFRRKYPKAGVRPALGLEILEQALAQLRQTLGTQDA